MVNLETRKRIEEIARQLNYRVDKNASNGWAFGADNSTIVLHGSVCDAVMAGTSKLVEIVFGCPGIAPSEVIP